MMNEPEWLRVNRAQWDERVGIHLNAPGLYQRDRLRAGQASLDPIVTEALGPVDGLNVLHLQSPFLQLLSGELLTWRLAQHAETLLQFHDGVYLAKF